MFINSKLRKYKIKKISENSRIAIDASKTAQLLKLNRKTINRYFNVFRTLIYQHQCSEKERFIGVIEVDESFFGPARLRGKPGPGRRGRGTLKEPIFGLYKRNGRVYTELAINQQIK